MTYTPSVNIDIGIDDNFQYIVTPNVRRVLCDIITGIQVGIHSFSIIGTYGTGKSSFIIELEEDLLHCNRKILLKNNSVFFGLNRFNIVNIVGEYKSLKSIIAQKFKCEEEDVLTAVKEYCQQEERRGYGVLIAIDEFGKILEHAANNNQEEELYFVQQLCEIINDSRRKTILLTTLHQNFGAYSQRLDDVHRQEWQKVRGRFKEVVFNEPVEQLLFLAAEQITKSKKVFKFGDSSNIAPLYELALKCKYISDSFPLDIAKKLYPLDSFSASCLTLAMQRYGQNERSLFSFLTSSVRHSLNTFIPQKNTTYNLACLYDYLLYNLYSSISEINIDSTNWLALKDAISRVEGGIFKDEDTKSAVNIVKSVGLLNIFGEVNTALNKDSLILYCELALGIKNAEYIISTLESTKVIRYANYKSKYIIFEGTDINIEAELLKAATIVPEPKASIDEIKDYIVPRIALASAAYYKNGTPRYFEFVIKNEPEVLIPEGDIDGYCELLFPIQTNFSTSVIEQSHSNPNANIYVVFEDVKQITKRLHEIKKLQYLLDNVVADDKIARREVLNIQNYEKDKLNSVLNDNLFSENGSVKWYFKGKEINVKSRRDFNSLLSMVCEKVYSKTPVMRNELFNKHKLSSAISLAKANLLDAVLNRSDIADLGFAPDVFPPEKTIYLSLLKNTGMHVQTQDGCLFEEPTEKKFRAFYDACNQFIDDTAEKPQKVSELIKMLATRPYKLKQGFIDIWVPIFLFIKQQNYALYSSNGTYIPNLSKEVLDLIWKKPSDFTIKAFNVDGIKLEFFKKYRKFLHQDESSNVTRKTFAQVYKPFLYFYKNLNEYAKNTRKFNELSVIKFRDTLANASDPETAFFEDLPEAFGYKGSILTNNDEFIADYIRKIQNAIRELNSCYSNLIRRIEYAFTSALGFPSKFEEYKPVIEEQFKNVKHHLLTQKTKMFLDRILTPSESSTEFVERISSLVLDRRLEQIKDKEEETVIDNIIFLFRELERYNDISNISEANADDRIFSFDICSNHGVSKPQKAYRLPYMQIKKADTIEASINRLLSGDDNMDICILLNLLSSKI